MTIDFRDALIALTPGILVILLPILAGVIFSLTSSGCIDVSVPDEIHHTHDVNVRVIDDTGDTA